LLLSTKMGIKLVNMRDLIVCCIAYIASGLLELQSSSMENSIEIQHIFLCYTHTMMDTTAGQCGQAYLATQAF
jgi:hypothetical protein